MGPGAGAPEQQLVARLLRREIPGELLHRLAMGHWRTAANARYLSRQQDGTYMLAAKTRRRHKIRLAWRLLRFSRQFPWRVPRELLKVRDWREQRRTANNERLQRCSGWTFLFYAILYARSREPGRFRSSARWLMPQWCWVGSTLKRSRRVPLPPDRSSPQDRDWTTENRRSRLACSAAARQGFGEAFWPRRGPWPT
jgi:hypothetical protein